MFRPALQQLISIGLFWRQFLVCGQEGLWGGGSWPRLGSVAGKMELPGEGG